MCVMLKYYITAINAKPVGVVILSKATLRGSRDGYRVYPPLQKRKKSYHPRHALTRWRLLIHVELDGHIIGQTRLVLELWAQPCSRQPLASRLAVWTTIGARIGHHIHLESSVKRKQEENDTDGKEGRER